ncbi:hypothetical protein GCM10007425_28120 [Lysinibacillus alkalisoli]|uniref:Uncharacterized protein n=1 Tax=Lysinibacillus alkalisoli TaxID=1911548 RepID=A0A917G9J3_9BACI|nr:hypothetical protein [Lysinibacillus alkalisoli]GGG31837.1 hypothetical protein GCM10007425_28120 [Lysinibacillus alkalisoli]
MSDTLIAAFLGAIITLIGQISTVYISNFKENLKFKQKEFQSKRDNLSEVYQALISAINSYPNESPADVLGNIKHGPGYSFERFETTLKSLDFQIEDYRSQLNNLKNSYEQKNDIELKISNREYAKKRIIEIQDEYFKARDNYKSFSESGKSIFTLYAGQDVRNALVSFEVIIHNVFISGYPAREGNDPLENNIDIARNNLIDSIRNDLGNK